MSFILTIQTERWLEHQTLVKQAVREEESETPTDLLLARRAVDQRQVADDLLGRDEAKAGDDTQDNDIALGDAKGRRRFGA